MAVKNFSLDIPIALKILLLLKDHDTENENSRGLIGTQIANVLNRTSNTVYEYLRFLEYKNLIIRKSSKMASMNRSIENFITEEGEELLHVQIYNNSIF